MPISPSYRAKQSPRLKTGGTVSTTGTYIPPKGGPSGPSSSSHPVVSTQKQDSVQPGR